MQTLKPEDLIVHSLTALFEDAGNQFSLSCKDQRRSTTYVLQRLRSEGIGFVTKTLPSLGKHFDACLKSGKYTMFDGFKTARHGTSPLIFKGLVQYVFDDDGTLLDEPDVNVIRFIRQLTLMFYKVEGEYPKELVDETIQNFIEVDENLEVALGVGPEKAAIILEAQHVVGRIFHDFSWGDLLPRPGPGQNATHIERNYLYEPLVKYTKLHEKFPYYRIFYGSADHLLHRVQRYRKLPIQTESVSLLTTVPKDSRGPRIICMEPPEFMWVQQGLNRLLVEHLERHPLTAGQVNFTDQTINGNLALQSSVTGQLATLDMKEASDRISRDLVACLFEEVPRLRDALLSATTDYVLTPQGAIRKRKYASMGSALCFPVMSVVHFALGVATIRVHTRRSIKAIAKDFYVYGDDLIAKTEYVEPLLCSFPEYGLKFNRAKCCYTGSFRESCGVDAFMGVNVTPTRVKKLSISKMDGTSVQSALAVHCSLRNKGFNVTASVFQSWIDSVIPGLPYVTEHSSALGWIVPRDHVWKANGIKAFKYDPHLQSLTLRARVITAAPEDKVIGDWERLLRATIHATQGDSGRFTTRTNARMRWKHVPLSAL